MNPCRGGGYVPSTPDSPVTERLARTAVRIDEISVSPVFRKVGVLEPTCPPPVS